MRLRVVLGCGLGVAAVALAGPPSWLPWAGWVRGHLPAWWMLPAIASGLLIAGAACLPGREPLPSRVRMDPWPTQHRADAVALGLGLLLLLEPLLHLTILGYLSRQGVSGGEELLLPVSVAARPGEQLVRIAMLCLLAPLAEELFFRGRLLPWLAARLGPMSALSITSLAFAVAHGSPLNGLVALPIGVLLGWLRLYRRDLGACVLVHQAHNGLFILAGPALVTAPLSAAVLAVGGAVMLTLAALHTPARGRAIPAGLALAAGLALLIQPMLALKDRWWADAVARVAARSRSEPGLLVGRLDAWRRQGRLVGERGELLRERFAGLGSDAGRAARLWQDGDAAMAGDQEEAEADLRAALRVARPPPPLMQGAAAIAARWPEAFAPLAAEDPARAMALIAPDGASRVLLTATGRARKLILASGERAWPGRFASVLLALPPEAVTPLDRRHLRHHYPEAEELIDGLDPARRLAWRQ